MRNLREVGLAGPGSHAMVDSTREDQRVSGIWDRMLRAAKLDADLYEEVEADRGATGQALVVVLMSSLAAGIGSWSAGGLLGVFVQTLVILAFWYVWAFITYYVGTRLFPEPATEADHGELLRTVGFATAPGVIRVLGVIPGLTGIVLVVAGIWILLAWVIAVRQALDYESTPRAIVVCVIGWLVYLPIQILVFAVFS